MRTSIEEIVEVEIERSLPEVWSFIADVERLPEWFAEFESTRKESDGPTGIGTVVRYTLQPGGRSARPDGAGTAVRRFRTKRR